MSSSNAAFKQRVARIRPDATLTIKQHCPHCAGGVIGMRSYCRQCSQSYTHEDLGQIIGDAETQPCGHPWSDFHEEDIICAECEGSETQHITVTMRELSYALWRMQPSLEE